MISHALLSLAALFVLAPSLPAVELPVDDFNRGQPVNNLGGETKAWMGDSSDPTTHLRASYDAANRRGSDGYALKFDYNLSGVRERLPYASQLTSSGHGIVPQEVQGTGFGGFTVVLKDFNASAYDYVSLWVKGDAAGAYSRRLRMEIHDGKESSSVWIEGITSQWQKFSFPFRSFRRVEDWSSLKTITFVFDQQLTAKTGVIYVDDIAFETAPDRVDRVEGTSFSAPRFSGRPGAFRDVSWKEAPHVALREDGAPDAMEAQFSWMWDEEFLYLYVQVRDGKIVNKFEKSDINKGDSVEVFLNPKDAPFSWEDPGVYRVGFAPSGLYDKPESWAWFQRLRPNDAHVLWMVQSSAKAASDPGSSKPMKWAAPSLEPPEPRGYICRAAIRWSWLGVKPKAGEALGMSVLVNDSDALDSTTQSRLSWNYALAENRVRLGRLVLK